MNEPLTLPEIGIVPADKLIPAPYSLERDMRGPEYHHVLVGVSKLGGIMYPIIVDRKLNVIDGHRRLRVAQTLEIAEVPVQYYDGNRSNLELYKDLNDLQEPLSEEDMRYFRQKVKEEWEKEEDFLDMQRELAMDEDDEE